MWEPVGPLPASVYWRRRLTAVAAAALLFGAGVWGVSGLLSPNDVRSPESHGTTTLSPSNVAHSAPDPTTDPTSGPTSTTPSLTFTDSSAPQRDPSSPATPAPGTTDPVPTSDDQPPPTSEQLRPDVTTSRDVPVPTPVPVPETGPVPCTNDMLDVSAEVDRPSYRVGERPVFRLVIVNATDQPCVRDLDPIRQEIVVWSGDGATRLWSSNDCFPASGVDLRTLVPAQPVVSAVTWAGRTSAPGCAGPRTEVGPGAYRVMTRLDDDISAPVPFLLNP
ncbi:hypothetical protein [Pseudonocardia thermophila]|uniref:hypothetical protein n=1 Tax=Pseudonocardia thermophila TaxID=1848 RepID=UPI00248DF5BC|nr:hypothetical protein [Pseudonocardia thermophila]